MRYLILLSLVLACVGCSTAPTADEPVRLRVMTWNIHHGEGTDGVFDLERLANAITAEAPDFVSLQEVDQGTTRASGVMQADELGRLTGMVAHFGRAIDYAGGEYGDAVLSAHDVERAVAYALPFEPGYEGRVAVATRAIVDGMPVVFIATHLDHTHNPTSRTMQAESLIALLSEVDDDALVILTGDLNATPDSDVIKMLTEHWTDTATDETRTFNADGADRRIDYVMYRCPRDVTVEAYRVIEDPIASDHNAIVVDLTVH